MDRTYEKYQNKMEYPNKKNFTTIFGYKNGECIFKKPVSEITQEDKDSASVIEKILDEEAYKKYREDYGKENTKLYELFVSDLFDEYGIQDSPKARKALSIAWEHGHSYGYGDVVSFFEDLVEIINM